MANLSLQYSYAHHIQRLMNTGNFCLLTGIEPAQVDQLYLGIYVDTIEWVGLPNTRGMSQFANGGLTASEAYTASGNYVNKMSDYCQSSGLFTQLRHSLKFFNVPYFCLLILLYIGSYNESEIRLRFVCLSILFFDPILYCANF